MQQAMSAEAESTVFATSQEVVQAAIDAYNRQDLEGFLRLHHATMVTAAPAAQPVKGLAGLRAALPQEWASFPDARIRVKRMVAQDPMAAVESVWSGTYRRTVPGLPEARGQQIRLSQVGIYTVRDGRINTLRSYYDPQELARQIGTSSTTPAAENRGAGRSVTGATRRRSGGGYRSRANARRPVYRRSRTRTNRSFRR